MIIEKLYDDWIEFFAAAYQGPDDAEDIDKMNWMSDRFTAAVGAHMTAHLNWTLLKAKKNSKYRCRLVIERLKDEE